MAVRFQLRRDTAANWTSANSVLALGEPGVETDTLKVKVGDGSTAWNSLAYSITKDFTDLTSTPTTLAGYGITDALILTNLSVTQNAASGTGAVTYNNATGVFSYTPPNFEGLDGNFTGSVFADDSTIMVDGVAATLNFANNSIDDLPNVDITSVAPTTGQALIWNNSTSKFIPGDSFSQSDFNTAFGNKSTTNLPEGTNLYYTDTRADARIALQAGANLDLSSKSTTNLSEGTNEYFTNARADARITAASIIDLSDADQSVQTTDDVTFANITTSGYLRGPASFVIDPAAFNDDTGTVVIAGNLQVDGLQTTINSTTVSIDDLNFSIATDAADSAAANGAGITIGGAGATLNYAHATTSWEMNKPLNITGDLGVSGTVGAITLSGAIAMGTNKITGMGDPAADQDAATKAYVDTRLNGSSNREVYTATAGQTTFSVTYDVGYVDVYVNGVKLAPADFTASNGTSIILATGATVNDIVDIVAYHSFVLADHYTGTQSDARYVQVAGDTMTGNLGIGVVPESGWSNTWDVAQIGLTASLSGISSGSTGRTFLTDNAYNDGNSQSASWQYQIADQASQIAMLDGKLEFRVATAGSADADITWNNAVIVDNAGNVGIGETSPDGLLHLKGGTATGDASHILFENTQGSKVFAIGGGATGVTNSNLFFRNVTDNTSPMVITDAGNVGIGVTPHAGWYGNATALQIATTGALYNTSNWEDLNLANNVYINTSGVDSYIQNDAACKIRLTDAGLMDFRVAGAGTAGNAISWNTALAIDSAGNATFGGTLSSGAISATGSANSGSASHLPALLASGAYGGGIATRDTKESGWYQQTNGADWHFYHNRTVASDTPASKIVLSFNSGGTATTSGQLKQGNSDGTPRFLNIPYASAASGFTFDWQKLANATNQGDQEAESNAFMFEVNVTSYLGKYIKAIIVVDTNSTNSLSLTTLHNAGITMTASIPTDSELITITFSGLWSNQVNYMGRITTF